MVAKRINRPEFIKMVARRSGLSVQNVTEVLQASEKELLRIILNGNSLLLRGFGKFYVQDRKGHPVNFRKAGSRVGDYRVMRFTPATKIANMLKK